jgi:hypothetical protein
MSISAAGENTGIGFLRSGQELSSDYKYFAMFKLCIVIYGFCRCECLTAIVANVEHSEQLWVLMHFETLKPTTFPNYLYQVSKSTCKLAYQVR